MDTEWSPTAKYIAGIGFIIIGVTVLYISRSVLGTLVASLLLVFITHPIVRFLHTRWRFPRVLATLTAFLVVALVVALVPTIVAPVAIDAIRAINFDAFVTWFQDSVDGLESWLVSIRTLQLFRFQVSLAAVVDPIIKSLAGSSPTELTSLERLMDLIPSAFSSVTSVAGFLATTISSAALSVFLTIVIAIYLQIDLPRFQRGFMAMVPEPYQVEYQTLLNKILSVWSSFFRGQLTVSLILSLLTWIGATAIGLPGAFILALTAGVLALIPSLGPVLSLIPALIVAMVQGSTYIPVSNFTFALIVLGLYILIQQIESNLVTPRIVGHAIDLPPVAVLVGVLVGTSVAGIFGAVLAAPTISSARVLALYAWNKMLGRDPFCMLSVKKLEPAQIPSLAETVRSTQQQIQERYAQLYSSLKGLTGEEEE